MERLYRVNDIFYSLQGEGRNTGRAAAFVRFAGCNLRCPFCDTSFDTYREMSGEAIVEAITPYPTRFVVLTGGEPTLQIDEALVDLLHGHGYEVAMESNGTRPAPSNLDWLTVSPKEGRREKGEGRSEKLEVRGERLEGRREKLEVRREKGEVRSEKLPDEIKIVFDENTDPESVLSLLTSHFSHLTSENLSLLTSHFSLLTYKNFSLIKYLQPCDTGDPERNARIVRACVDYIKAHPEWRLSLQTHKLIGIE